MREHTAAGGAVLLSGILPVFIFGCAARRSSVPVPLPGGGSVTGVVTAVSQAESHLELRTDSGANYDVSTAHSLVLRDGQAVSVAQLQTGTPVRVLAPAMDERNLELEASRVTLLDTSPVLVEVPSPVAHTSPNARAPASSAAGIDGFLSSSTPDLRAAHSPDADLRTPASPDPTLTRSEQRPRSLRNAYEWTYARYRVRKPSERQSKHEVKVRNSRDQAADSVIDLPPDDSRLSPEEEYALNHPPDLTFNPADHSSDQSGSDTGDGSDHRGKTKDNADSGDTSD